MPAGNIGAIPSADSQELNATVTAQSMMSTPEQFRNIIVKYDSTGAYVFIKESYHRLIKLNTEVVRFTQLNGESRMGACYLRTG